MTSIQRLRRLRNLFVLQRLGALQRDEQGAALTEVVMCLPFFILVFGGLMNLGLVGQQSVATKHVAAHDMWAQVYNEGANNALRMSPRTQLPETTNLDSVQGFAALGGDIAAMASGHWGEAWFHAELAPVLTLGQIDYDAHSHDAARRLKQHMKPPHEMTGHILGGTSEGRRPVLAQIATNDNLIDGNLTNPGGNMLQWLLTSVLQATGGVPGAFAAIRYGDQDGVASHQVSLYGGRLAPTFYARYSAMLSPHPTRSGEGGGGSGEEVFDLNDPRGQWGLYYVAAQTTNNYRWVYNMMNVQFDEAETQSTATRYEAGQ
ncbi:hypothetical protein FRC98_09895 [Lujinxingia vulgaris]|uniref:Uncharacterized protein n=1 Tax=Lujinxingia vulgaris TaxID=2600176 RepID=A0A5C6XIE4_9DELT|nr:hypothetical protein [Lujinxingia vulgaris]TXD37042.1 hypothetical protein FRC98_09895 [Lujinxingia vulgaris]